MGMWFVSVRTPRAALMTQQNLAIVVIGYESSAEWEGFFDSIVQSTIEPASIVVVDNSPASSIDARDWPSLPLRVLHLPANPGYGAAANRGVQELHHDIDWVVICNPDTRLSKTALEELLSAVDVFPNTAILGPAVRSSDGSIYPSAREIPGVRIGIGHALFARIWPANRWTTRYLGGYTGSAPRSVGWLSGSFLLAKRGVFEAIGGFDEAFFMFFEDVDLGRRTKSAGYRNVYVPQAEITHSGAHATSLREKEMILAHHRSAERFLSKLYPHPWQGALRLALITGLRIRARWQIRQLT